uniref:Carboxyvinyl-carboxyphosphonate phosphorylmutase n=1 Tax=Chromera velia CCMP2878 TaxID=1169474 RepID=A0A0G4I971_9ALVE|mmetsp:Transcript_12955/g.25325  ORF Transcript_12955/g.25325 Transcript_12955/m.25325 type:complete len:312 (-) Transcript_12955:606-1541(-)|eukprot:Cvel_12155.t1-p1 / transcript=Cvel_12155.t1 / gene=Cvel_12155 / organism=Chromera_velia_CCMP2878 / gene_product=2,3-dimethylmalate lyase, putative / transcript_product=2,3-dimethylmalate lyase, putative / location=Cvel_scaffold784:8366-10649(-) / protein_length=311 / sequence_SO=supercontig / SO=protein_coding / is_pseudo=false
MPGDHLNGTGTKTVTPAGRLRALLSENKTLVMPCCYDGITARLVEDGGFPLTFMTGFGVSASRGFPDAQLVSFGEMLSSATTIVAALRKGTPCIADGDTGYGNAVNVKRTVRGYAQVGMAGVMIEDQVAPKRCGHTRVKAVVGFDEALARVRAACDARDEIRSAGLYGGNDICVMARTDANNALDFEEALRRCRAFREAGADITFLEAPKSIEEMKRYCEEVEGPKLANMVEGGKTPVLPPSELQKMGYSIAAYPVSLLSASIGAMRGALEKIHKGEKLEEGKDILPFSDVCRQVGFEDYWEEEARYKTEK